MIKIVKRTYNISSTIYLVARGQKKDGNWFDIAGYHTGKKSFRFTPHIATRLHADLGIRFTGPIRTPANQFKEAVENILHCWQHSKEK